MDSSQHKPIALWLFACCAMVMGMVVIGGLTRLTGSGLSMVTWTPVLGWLPPMTQSEWQEVFQLYQQSPEFVKVNSDMVLEGFKGIFWLEFIHRLLGRVIGLVFLLPFLYFLFKKRIPHNLTPKLLTMFLLGGLQGVVGWYMVKSGLVDDPRVSQYRLTAHLGLAVTVYAYMLWVGLGLYFNDPSPAPSAFPVILHRSKLLTILIFITLLSGGFVAGLDAGLVYNTFPMMEGRWIPEGYLAHDPWLVNFFENVATVQWDHRLMATLTFMSVLVFAWSSLKHPLPKMLLGSIRLLVAMTIVQVTLGILTLLSLVQISLASAHQVGALILFTFALFVTHRLRAAR